jgi:ribose transport system ATP-binding protein
MVTLPLPLLRLSGIEKSFPGVRALKSASFDLLPGEIHALVGENGAGKSTLIRVLTGAHQPDAGRVEVEGTLRRFDNPQAAQRAGIAAIYQEFQLVPGLSVSQNLSLGREPARWGFLRSGAEHEGCRRILQELGADLDPDMPAGRCDLAGQQMIEIARALLARPRVLIMDEPTAALTPREVERLFGILRRRREQGEAVLFVSHRLNEVMEIADRITVLRDGETLGTWAAADLSLERMISLMVGRSLEQTIPRLPRTPGEEILAVEKLRGGRIHEASFSLRRGEILGLAGLTGAGRTDLARLIFGADRVQGGEIRLEGRPVRIDSPAAAIGLGVGLLTEDRKREGLVLGLSARENFALPNLPRWSRWGWIDRSREASAFLRHVVSLKIRLAGPEQPAGHLSGGNQQKLLVARWLESESKVLLFDEPTRGIDVGAKYEMYNLMQELAARGKGIVLISSEMPEVLGLSDRILVLHDGRITGEIRDARGATQEQVLQLAVQ